jgi:hypothetical protein
MPSLLLAPICLLLTLTLSYLDPNTPLYDIFQSLQIGLLILLSLTTVLILRENYILYHKERKLYEANFPKPISTKLQAEIEKKVITCLDINRNIQVYHPELTTLYIRIEETHNNTNNIDWGWLNILCETYLTKYATIDQQYLVTRDPTAQWKLHSLKIKNTTIVPNVKEAQAQDEFISVSNPTIVSTISTRPTNNVLFHATISSEDIRPEYYANAGKHLATNYLLQELDSYNN